MDLLTVLVESLLISNSIYLQSLHFSFVGLLRKYTSRLMSPHCENSPKIFSQPTIVGDKWSQSNLSFTQWNLIFLRLSICTYIHIYKHDLQKDVSSTRNVKICHLLISIPTCLLNYMRRSNKRILITWFSEQGN